MGAFEKLFEKLKEKKQVNSYFQMLSGYSPVFTSHDGGVYEMELTRSCIHAFANHASKLQPNVTGADARGLAQILEHRPNMFQTTAQFLYKAATVYDTQNTLIILPVIDAFDETIGFYPADPASIELVAASETGEPFVRVSFQNGKRAAVELSRCGIVSKYLYHHDIFGESNRVLDPTMDLLSLQNQGISEGIKNGASFRFMANISNFTKATDLKRERETFVRDNLGQDSGGLALFPNTYTNVKQIMSQPKIVDPDQMRIIQERVFNYFGSNEDILQNKAVGDSWSAFYEGKIEPFALQLSQAMTNMTYSKNEMTRGNGIIWTANRLQYMTNTDKLNVSSQMFDRGILTTNQIMDIWNLAPVEDGDKRYIRKEYTEVSNLDNVETAAQETKKEEMNADTEEQNQIQE